MITILGLGTVYEGNRLKNLKLGATQALEGSGEARTWLLPILRAHVRSARLALWGAELLPVARAMGSHAAHLATEGPNRRLEALQFQVVITTMCFRMHIHIDRLCNQLGLV